MNKTASLVTVHIRDLSLETVIGTEPAERLAPQKIVVNISFDYDGALAAQTDALGHAVDYGALHHKVLTRVPQTQFFLLERLAGFILDLIMEDSRIVSASVRIEKPAVLKNVRSVAVEMASDREGRKPPATTRCY